MPLTFLKIKKERKRKVVIWWLKIKLVFRGNLWDKLKSLPSMNSDAVLMWPIHCIYEWAQKLNAETLRMNVEGDQEPLLPFTPPPLLMWSGPQKLTYFFWEAKVYTGSLDSRRIRSGLLLFWKSPFSFSITLDLSAFLFSLCCIQTNTFLLALIQ